MFCIGVYEKDREKVKRIRERILRYSMQTDRDFDIFWFVDSSVEEKIEKYASKIQMVFLSLDFPEGKQIGDKLYRFNPKCLICYYKSAECNLESVLSSRPIAFYEWNNQKEEGKWNEKDEEFVEKLDRMIKEVLDIGHIFSYDTRKMKYLLPVHHILYFQSNLKYVEIYMQSKEKYSIYTKLSEIEEKLKEEHIADSFLRIHKSYIVNIAHIKALDKASHMIWLSDDICLPVSEAHYTNVVKKLSY